MAYKFKGFKSKHEESTSSYKKTALYHVVTDHFTEVPRQLQECWPSLGCHLPTVQHENVAERGPELSIKKWFSRTLFVTNGTCGALRPITHKIHNMVVLSTD